MMLLFSKERIYETGVKKKYGIGHSEEKYD